MPTTAEPRAEAPAELRLPIPDEPITVRDGARALIERDPSAGAALVDGGEWIADHLWGAWRAELEPAGMTRRQLSRVAADYRRELWLWIMGEHPWRHCADGLAGRVRRRLAD